MQAIKTEDIERLLALSNVLTPLEFNQYISNRLSNTKDPQAEIQEIDQTISKLHNHIFLLSILTKQRYILLVNKRPDEQKDSLFTKQEVAIKFRVSLRTVNNWIQSGLQITSIGGIVRIKESAIEEFIKYRQSKQIRWKSISS